MVKYRVHVAKRLGDARAVCDVNLVDNYHEHYIAEEVFKSIVKSKVDSTEHVRQRARDYLAEVSCSKCKKSQVYTNLVLELELTE